MTSYSFRKHQPLSLRLWHWLNALAIFGLLGTVLLRKTFLSWRTNSALIEAKLRYAGTTVSADLAKEIAVAIRSPMWDWHVYLGFALGALLLGRVVARFVGGAKGPAGDALRAASSLKSAGPADKLEALHYTLVKTGHALFYLAAAFMVVTGFALQFKAGLGISKGAVGAIKQLHELTMWIFVAFVAGHLIGVVVAENRGDAGLVSDMLHGGERDASPPR